MLICIAKIHIYNLLLRRADSIPRMVGLVQGEWDLGIFRWCTTGVRVRQGRTWFIV